jgi:hypothetical protein
MELWRIQRLKMTRGTKMANEAGGGEGEVEDNRGHVALVLDQTISILFSKQLVSCMCFYEKNYAV